MIPFGPITVQFSQMCAYISNYLVCKHCIALGFSEPWRLQVPSWLTEFLLQRNLPDPWTLPPWHCKAGTCWHLGLMWSCAWNCSFGESSTEQYVSRFGQFYLTTRRLDEPQGWGAHGSYTIRALGRSAAGALPPPCLLASPVLPSQQRPKVLGFQRVFNDPEVLWQLGFTSSEIDVHCEKSEVEKIRKHGRVVWGKICIYEDDIKPRNHTR